jgi:hypothetical protein
MKMKVAVPDAERGFVLAGKLARYGAEVVMRDGNGSYEVALDEPSSQELPTVLGLIERWIEDERVDAARVQLDGRSYTMELHTAR